MLNASDKPGLVRGYLERSGLRTMVETGSYMGGGCGMWMPDLWDTYHLLDLFWANCEAARENCPAAIVHHGDSGTMLPLVLEAIHGPAFFWLDAHLVVDIDEVDALDAHPCPLAAELDAILAWPHAAGSTVLVDDMRLLGSYGWPGRAEILARTHLWDSLEADDILRLTPRA